MPSQGRCRSAEDAGGCPARIRTSIDGVRVRSLTIRRRGSLGARGIESGPFCLSTLRHPAPAGLALDHQLVIKPESSQPPARAVKDRKWAYHGAGSRQCAGSAAGVSRAERAVGSGVFAEAGASPSYLWRDRSRHQQLPPADRSAERRAASPSSTPFRASSASAKACRAPANCRRTRWTARSARSPSAPTSSGAATSRCPARSRPKPAAAPRTGASSPSGSAAKRASHSTSSSLTRKLGSRSSAATSCSSRATAPR